MFLPAYSPEFAPIELFFNTFKCRLAHQCKNQTVNLSKDIGTRNIKETLATFTRKEVISYWVEALKKVNHQIQSVLDPER